MSLAEQQQYLLTQKTGSRFGETSDLSLLFPEQPDKSPSSQSHPLDCFQALDRKRLEPTI